MRIAILGATSQIAGDLTLQNARQQGHELLLFARQPAALAAWLAERGLHELYRTHAYQAFADGDFDAIINFVGVGDPARSLSMGHAIFDVTIEYDNLALNYLQHHPGCRYIFLSSGAAYGGNFAEPAHAEQAAQVNINNLAPQDWYTVAKLHAECRHRALAHQFIYDVRVFNYFSHTMDISQRFLITDMLRAIREDTVMKTSADYIVRDYLHPEDFYRLIDCLLTAPAANAAVDCYSRKPVDKPALLAGMTENFGLRYEVVGSGASVNAFGHKSHYYSRNRIAERFGYAPGYSALEGVLIEAGKLLGR